MKSNLHAVNSSTSGHPIRGLDQSDPDRRFRLDAMPNTVMSSLRWLSRPQMLDGNPAYSYMVEMTSVGIHGVQRVKLLSD